MTKEITIKYWDADGFANAVINAAKLNGGKPEEMDMLMQQLKGMLMDRISRKIVDELGNKELFLLHKLKEDHPNLDILDAISLVVPSAPYLKNKLHKTTSDLFTELVHYAELLKQK